MEGSEKGHAAAAAAEEDQEAAAGEEREGKTIDDLIIERDAALEENKKLRARVAQLEAVLDTSASERVRRE